MYKSACSLLVVLSAVVTICNARGLYRPTSDDVEPHRNLVHLDPKMLRYLLKEMTSEDESNNNMEIKDGGDVEDDFMAGYYLAAPTSVEYMLGHGEGYMPPKMGGYRGRGAATNSKRSVGGRQRSARSLHRDSEFGGHKRDIRTPEEAYNEWILANLG